MVAEEDAVDEGADGGLFVGVEVGDGFEAELPGFVGGRGGGLLHVAVTPELVCPRGGWRRAVWGPGRLVWWSAR